MVVSQARRQQTKLLLITFLISPFLTLLITMYHYRWKGTQLFFILSVSFLGYNIGIEGDLIRYYDWFFRDGGKSWSEIFNQIITLQAGDFYTLILSKIIFYLTENVRVYFAVLISVYAYFYSSVMKLIIVRLSRGNNLKVLLLFIGFATFFFVRNFISVRFSTALLLYAYAMLEIVLNGNRKFILLSLCVPLIHIGFVVTIPLLPLYFFFKDRVNVCIMLLLVSFVFNQGNVLNFFGKASSNYENTVFSSKFSAYASESGIEYLSERYQESEKGANLKLKTLNYFTDLVYILCMIGSGILIFEWKSLLYDRIQLHLFNLTLLLWSLANVMQNISNGVRFLNLWVLIVLALWVLILQNKTFDRKWQIFIRIFIVVLLFKNLATLIAANPLFTTEFFVSNYIINLFL